MPRIPRLIVRGEEAVYHVISRTALDGYVLDDEEKEYMVDLIKWLSTVFFVDIYGYCIMGNHFHLLLKMNPHDGYDDDEVTMRAKNYYQAIAMDKNVMEHELTRYREKFSDLSEFIKEIKQRFSRYYNKKHKRKGFFWGGRFKSVLIEKGEALINCLAYIELNPVRAGLVNRPEDYRWCSLAYLMTQKGPSHFVSMDYGLEEFLGCEFNERLARLRRFVYEKGAIPIEGKASIPRKIMEKEAQKGFSISMSSLFLHKIRYFSDGGILGSRDFVRKRFFKFKDLFTSRDKIPRVVPGVPGLDSMKRLSVS